MSKGKRNKDERKYQSDKKTYDAFHNIIGKDIEQNIDAEVEDSFDHLINMYIKLINEEGAYDYQESNCLMPLIHVVAFRTKGKGIELVREAFEFPQYGSEHEVERIKEVHEEMFAKDLIPISVVMAHEVRSWSPKGEHKERLIKAQENEDAEAVQEILQELKSSKDYRPDNLAFFGISKNGKAYIHLRKLVRTEHEDGTFSPRLLSKDEHEDDEWLMESYNVDESNSKSNPVVGGRIIELCKFFLSAYNAYAIAIGMDSWSAERMEFLRKKFKEEGYSKQIDEQFEKAFKLLQQKKALKVANDVNATSSSPWQVKKGDA